MGAPATQRLELPIEGMTCASCAAQIERRLNKLDGVAASVNYATERAAVDFDAALVDPEALVAAVEQAGYRARLPRETAPEPVRDRADDLRVRLLVSAVLALPVVVLGMVPAFQFRNWQWLALQLATPVVLWGGWPFHRAALQNLRHRGATMDTLVSVGTLAAYGWSLVALFVLDAGRPGMTMPFELRLSRAASSDSIYLEAAAAVVVFLLAGAGSRPAPSGVRGRRSGPSSSSGRGTQPYSATTESSSASPSSGYGPATASSSGPARRWRPTGSSSRAAAPSTSRSSPARASPSRSARATRSPEPV